MSPIVSVIIPTFNRWPLVGEAIESVLVQSYQNFELIVVDDGSNDNTRPALAQFGARVRLYSQPRAGVSAARNFGVGQARGRFLAFLDSDDLWRAEKLEVQTAYMEKHREIQVCQTEEIWVRGGMRINPRTIHRKPHGDIFYRSLERCLVSPSAVMMTRMLFDRVGGFDESLPVCEDYDLWLRIAVDHFVSLIPQALVVKRGGHADQLSHSMWGMDRYRVVALQKLLRSGLGGARRTATLDMLRRKLIILAQGSRKRGKQQEAATYDKMIGEFLEESVDVGDSNTGLRGGQRVPLANRDAVA